MGENRAQELERKAAALPGAFTWDFIGHLQSRKVKQILPHVRLIHSVASDTVLAQLERHGDASTRVLVEVNIAREPGKSGVDPGQVAAFIDRCPVAVVGLMTMPPLAPSPEDSRPHFAALAELARGLGLPQLSMGTSQDYRVAVEEGATIVRLGTILVFPGARHNPRQGNVALPRTLRPRWHSEIHGTARWSTSVWPRITPMRKRPSPTTSPRSSSRIAIASGPTSAVSSTRRRRDEIDDIFADDAGHRAARHGRAAAGRRPWRQRRPRRAAETSASTW